MTGRFMLTATAIGLLLGACGDGEPDAGVVEPTTQAVTLRDPSHLVEVEDPPLFERGVAAEGIDAPTTLAFGPDGRLYVGQQNGRIVALTLDRGVAVATEVIAGEDVFGEVLGIAFNPTDGPEPVTLYVSHTQLYRGLEGPAYAGAVARLVAPVFAPVDIVSGLPVSAAEHGTNGISFDEAGRLYIAQGGTTNAGVPSERHPRPETPLSSAILIADLGAPGFDGAMRYAPPDEASDTVDLAGGGVRVFAAGFRNPYDLVLHSNGRIYATDNGPNEPDGVASLGCDADGEGVAGPDELNLIVEGGYYGHPNRNRGRADERQCTYRPPTDATDGTTGPIATLGYHTSSNGLAEYRSDAFGGALLGDLLYVEWVTGRVWRVMLSDDGASVEGIARLVPEEFEAPLDVAVAPDGTVYIAEQRAGRIAYLAPAE